jgi:DNA-binding XRE family transcriptional regulator
MIKNEREYRITKAQVKRFEQALQELERRNPDDSPLPPLAQKMQHDALQGQLDTFRTQLADYEALQQGKLGILEMASFDELPTALIQARIAAGLSQRQLAERMGIKEQQVQLYESTNYASASLRRINQVINALGVKVRALVTR